MQPFVCCCKNVGSAHFSPQLIGFDDLFQVIAILDKIKAEKKTLADEDYEEEAESSVSAQDDRDWESDDPDEDIIYVK